MKIAIATDAWAPQINGVVRTLIETVRKMRSFGHEVEVISPEKFRNLPCPGYDEIRLAIMPRFGVRTMLRRFEPDVVHIATEGPIGWTARRWCLTHNRPFTSAFHTRFPEYLAVRTGLDPKHFWPVLRRFHTPSKSVLVATPSLATELADHGIHHTRQWSRGVDLELFRPRLMPHPRLANLPRPVLLSVGRVSVEKNLEAFLASDVLGTKVVVGDGPARAQLQKRYPAALFLGSLSGEELARAYAAADAFVFPSLTDTFGLVIIEALACGVPVAAFPVSGPLDILGQDGRGRIRRHENPAGVVDWDLDRAITRALKLRRVDAAILGHSFSWEASARQFEQALIDVRHESCNLQSNTLACHEKVMAS